MPIIEALPTTRISEVYRTVATQPAEPKPQLTVDQIFFPDNGILTQAGRVIQAVIGFRKILNDPESGISDGRRKDVVSNIEELSIEAKKNGIDISTMRAEDLESQFNEIVAARTEDIDNEGSFQGVPQAPQS